MGATDDTPIDVPQREQPWQRGKACGVNSLYFLLKLNGKNVNLKDLTARLAPTSRGSSLAELRQAAADEGLVTEVIRTNKEGLKSVDLPCIVHFDQPGDLDHISLLTGFTDRGVSVIDGTELVPVKLTNEQFYKLWSGYAIRTRGLPWRQYLKYMILLQLTIVLAIVFVWKK